MRQVKKPRESARGRSSRPQGRGGKTPARAPQPRTRRRPDQEDGYGFDPEGAIERLRMSFPLRYPVLTLAGLVLVMAVVAGVIAGGHIGKTGEQLSQSFQRALVGMGFSVRAIELSGNERTSEEEAYSALGVEPGGSIFAIDPAAARKRLVALPWIADAEVSRRLPGTLAIHLVEKRPFALFRTGNQVAVIERSGAVITREGAEAFHLPVITGDGAPEAAGPFIDVLAAHRLVSPRVQLIQRMGDRRWDLKLDGGITVRLPEFGWQNQLDELETLIAKRGILERNIEIIDLRYPDNLFFRLQKNDSRPAPRQQKA